MSLSDDEFNRETAKVEKDSLYYLVPNNSSLNNKTIGDLTKKNLNDGKKATLTVDDQSRFLSVPSPLAPLRRVSSAKSMREEESKSRRKEMALKVADRVHNIAIDTHTKCEGLSQSYQEETEEAKKELKNSFAEFRLYYSSS